VAAVGPAGAGQVLAAVAATTPNTSKRDAAASDGIDELSRKTRGGAVGRAVSSIRMRRAIGRSRARLGRRTHDAGAVCTVANTTPQRRSSLVASSLRAGTIAVASGIE